MNILKSVKKIPGGLMVVPLLFLSPNSTSETDKERTLS